MNARQRAKLKELYEKATKGPVTVSGRQVCGGTDDEPRHIAICGWNGEAKLYAAMRNALPQLLAALEAKEAALRELVACEDDENWVSNMRAWDSRFEDAWAAARKELENE